MLYSPDKITKATREIIEQAHSISVSIVSLWELALKYSVHKLPYAPAELIAGIEALQISELPLRSQHLVTLPEIELGHKDPFDQLLLAQAQSDQLVFLTADTLLIKSSYLTADARV